MEPLVRRWFDEFAKLDDDSKVMLLQMGIESFMRAWTFHTAGLSTLKGAMHYVASDSPALCDVLLHALNGSRPHREVLRGFMAEDRCKRLAFAFHPANAEAHASATEGRR